MAMVVYIEDVIDFYIATSKMPANDTILWSLVDLCKFVGYPAVPKCLLLFSQLRDLVCFNIQMKFNRGQMINFANSHNTKTSKLRKTSVILCFI